MVECQIIQDGKIRDQVIQKNGLVFCDNHGVERSNSINLIVSADKIVARKFSGNISEYGEEFSIISPFPLFLLLLYCQDKFHTLCRQ